MMESQKYRFAFPVFSHTGLCNMLFPWARAVAWCHESGAEMVAPKWTDWFRLGPWLRGDRDKRYYLHLFTNTGYRHRLFGVRTHGSRVKRFEGMEGFFDKFICHQEFIRKELLRITNPLILDDIKSLNLGDFIGVHIRRGDFKRIGQSVSDDWYVRAIKEAIALVGSLPIKIFSDEDAQALVGITEGFPNICIMPPRSALQDLILLSRSKVLVCTANSSFSMWAVFLGQMPSFWGRNATMPRMYLRENLAMFVD